MQRSSILLAAVLALLGAAGCRKPGPAPEAPKPAPAASAPAPAPAAAQAAPAPDDSAARQAQDAAEAARMAAAELRKAAEASLQDIHFDLDEPDIKPSEKPILQGIADFMKKYPQARLTIDGNCDARGAVEYNLALGERRAIAARDYLVRLGVSASRLDTLSYGKEKPLCAESTESCWSRNRRDHFSLNP
jgi:peptidoglycan-associated lipoprotein